MLILLTNDDGIYSPGLSAIEKSLRRLGDVVVVAPATEQSGVGHAITFLTPLSAKKVFIDEEHWGWAIDGTPADCVKIGITQICSQKPDLVVSGINNGLNSGINVLYSGTVGAAVEAAFYGLNSFAVSLEHSEKDGFSRAAEIAVDLIEHVLESSNGSVGLYNINIPMSALESENPEMRVVPMDTNQYWNSFERRVAPSGKMYFWLVGRPMPTPGGKGIKPSSELTDIHAISQGFVTLTPLGFDMTRHEAIAPLRNLEKNFTPKPREGQELPDKMPRLRTQWMVE